MNQRIGRTRNLRFVGRKLAVAAVALILGALLLTAMMSNAAMLVRLGLTGYFWYVLLLFLGFSVGVATFELFESHASYTGNALGGTVKLGGPIVVTILVVILGFHYVPQPLTKFDVTVFLHGQAGPHERPLRNQGTLSLDLGADRRQEPIGDKGEARFAGIPNDMRDRSVVAMLVAEKYELAEPELVLKSDQEALYVSVKAKSLPLVGAVLDSEGRPLAHARVTIAGQTATTDADGHFGIKLPADLPENERTVSITAHGYELWRAAVVPGGNSLQVRMTALRNQ
jgi:hypothetical protein